MTLTPEVVQDARILIRQSNKKITASELARTLRIKPFEATHLIKTTPLLEFHNVQAMPEELSMSSMMTMENLAMEPQQSTVVMQAAEEDPQSRLIASQGCYATVNSDLQCQRQRDYGLSADR